MTYVDAINALRPGDGSAGRVLDLFAGAGGLALGFEAAGFATVGYEMDRDCCTTYGRNLAGTCVRAWLDQESSFPPADVVVGGPPCQPFSVLGDQRGPADRRNGLPAFVAAVARVRPAVFLLENVRGTQYRHRAYFETVLADLRGLGYEVEARLLRADRYGVPQRRERVVVVGHRGGFAWPAEVFDTVTAADAIGDTAQTAPERSKFLTPGQDAYVARYEAKSHCRRPRDLDLGRAARTLTCRNLAAATGDMLRVRLPDGRRRRLTVREAARLQSFPDWFAFAGTEASAFRQIGNAVPPLLALALARAVRAHLGS